MSITISIPVYNSEKNILNLIEDSEKVLSHITDDYEILVINDGSIDNTGRLLDGLDKKKVRILHHKFNKGFGETLKEVFTLPKKKYVFFIPGDGQIHPSELFKMYKYIKNYDLVIGLRKNRADSIIRKLNSKLYNFIISLIVLRKIRDVNSVVLFDKSILSKIKFKSKSAFIHAELLLKAQANKCRIIEVEIGHRKRRWGRGSGGRIDVILKTIFDMVLYILGLL